MTLYEKWQGLIENQTDDTFKDFWEEYSGAEERIYTHILKGGSGKISGKLSELANDFNAKAEIFMGFLDGISSSLKNKIDLEKIDEESEINLDIDFKVLLFNMLKADADYLYNISYWDDVLSPEERMAILKEYKKSKIVVKEKTPGRNEPCPCGSGKKYKHCCGR